MFPFSWATMACSRSHSTMSGSPRKTTVVVTCQSLTAVDFATRFVYAGKRWGGGGEEVGGGRGRRVGGNRGHRGHQTPTGRNGDDGSRMEYNMKHLRYSECEYIKWIEQGEQL